MPRCISNSMDFHSYVISVTVSLISDFIFIITEAVNLIYFYHSKFEISNYKPLYEIRHADKPVKSLNDESS